ncbi:MAG: hypothetical protein ABIR30_07795 [Chitinophagaceae bacterium]
MAEILFIILSQLVLWHKLCFHLVYQRHQVKKYILLLSFPLLTIQANSQGKKINDILGRWEIGGDNNKGAYLQIIDSSTIILNYMGETKTLVDCKIDFSKNPAWFDFSAKDTSSILRFKSLLMIVGEDMIKWQIFIDEERPSHFSSTKGELLYLKKTRAGSAAVATN